MGNFRVWAPRAKQVELVFEPTNERLMLVEAGGGYFQAEDQRIRPGQCYRISLDGGQPLPDPRSQHQPEGVFGPSCWVDFESFVWTDAEFRACPLAQGVIYELHVGTFTTEGTFESAIARLPHLRQLGVTHIEVMPVAHFAGSRGWGYDGVCLFAPHTAYGGPSGLQTFVNACHDHGLAVILDVVYNHLGPTGNVLGQYGPYFSSKYHTPWGDAVNYDAEGSDGVRRLVCDNAKFWLSNYHFDGLRLDAVHAFFDQSATHILAQLVSEVDDLALQSGRHLVLIAESDLNDARVVNPAAIGGYGAHAQWSDDFHHALHAYLTGENSGYYRDYGRLEHLAEALRHGFVYRGTYSAFRDRSFGGPTNTMRARQFVVSSQNHDQVGNRAVGDRLSATLTQQSSKIAAALTLLSPFVPLLFMGEEWGCRQPFQYFAEFEDAELQRSVRENRLKEFAAFGWNAAQLPDPGAVATYENCKLDWSAVERAPHSEMHTWYQSLVALRREMGGAECALTDTKVEFDERERWLSFTRGNFTVVCNFAEERRTRSWPGDRLRLSSATDARHVDDAFDLPPHSVVVLEKDQRQLH
jgi:maltooligosyltrehalose trehalohydrolase